MDQDTERWIEADLRMLEYTARAVATDYGIEDDAFFRFEFLELCWRELQRRRAEKTEPWATIDAWAIARSAAGWWVLIGRCEGRIH